MAMVFFPALSEETYMLRNGQALASTTKIDTRFYLWFLAFYSNIEFTNQQPKCSLQPTYGF